ncbi:hypothetical protein L1987_46337 [Smallanthus sonchifolius]|uniref:Uncharacterized protein n=1 Tax=Smallanthus sonchifolius TaxID=185202 RepID=A0ACB9G0F1_9ASTR|nr:hypothetical protein L1987_46337 [Smallanthus sonchifolius]
MINSSHYLHKYEYGTNLKNVCSSPQPMILSSNDFELTVVKETPRNNDHEPLIVKETPIKETCHVTLESVSEDEMSNSTIFQTKFPEQQLPHSFSSSCSTSDSGCMHAFVTPNKQHISQTGSPSLDLSVNSRFHKIRKTSVVKMEPLGSPDPKTPTEIMKFSVPQSCILEVPDTLSNSFGDVMKKDLKISCSLCRHSLGLEENNYIVPCSLMSLSKVHLVSIWKGDLEKPVMGPTSVVVMVSDITSVDTKEYGVKKMVVYLIKFSALSAVIKRIALACMLLQLIHPMCSS